MSRTLCLSILAVSMAAGCSSSSSHHSTGAPGGDKPTKPDTTDTPDSSTGASSDASVDKDMEYMDIDEGTFTVPPGGEVTWCVRIPIPEAFRGRTLGLMGWQSDLPKPTHHFFISYSQNALDGSDIVPCNGTNGVEQASNLIGEFDPSVGVSKILFGAGVGKNEVRTDTGYGRILETTGSLVTNHHVLNTGTETVNMYGRFTLEVKDVSLVSHPMSPFTCGNPSISLPPGSTKEVTGTCTAPFDMDIALMSSHAHARLTKVETRFYDGQQTQPDVLYTSDQWDSPKLQIMANAPLTPLHVLAGQGLTFTCYYQNTTDHTINYGLSANDEMCLTFNGYAYPADRTFEVPPMLSTFTAGTTPAMVQDSTNSSFFF